MQIVYCGPRKNKKKKLNGAVDGTPWQIPTLHANVALAHSD